MVGLVLAVCKEYGSDTIYDNELDRGRREGLFNGFGGLSIKSVVGTPIVAHMSEQKGTHLIKVLCVEQTGKVEPLFIVEHGELGDADVREILGTKSEELPHFRVDGGKSELLAQIAVFLL